jgi:competence protein ComEC
VIDLRLAAPAGCAWLGLVVALPTPDVLPALAAGAAGGGAVALATAAGVSRIRRRRASTSRLAAGLALVALCLMTVAAVTAIAAVREPLRAPAVLDRPVSVVLRGTVSARPMPAAGQVRVLATRLDVQSRPESVRMPVLVTGLTLDSPSALPRIHDVVTVSGRLAAAKGGGDIAAFLDASAPITIEARAGVLDKRLDELRARFVTRTDSLPGDGGALLPGLSIGDTARVDDSLRTAMEASSLSHLTAVSGANCAVVVAAIFLLTGALSLPRLARLGLAALVLVGFVALVTPDPSVDRAAVMGMIALALTAAGRPVAGLPMLSLAVLVLLVADPWTSRSYAFALSVSATAGLIVLAGPLARLLGRVLPDGLALALAVPTAAQLACQPILLTLNPQVPVLGIVANLLAEPAAPVATVLGLLACLLSGAWPAAALGVSWVAWLPATWIAAVARFTSALPENTIDWGASVPALALSGLLVVLVGAVVLTTPFRRSRRIAVASLLVVALPLATIATGRELGRRTSFPHDWQMVQCDIGQGDANLIRSEGRVALIDTGDDEGLLQSCLDLVGVGRIDVLVLTHFDRDHVGASRLLAGRIGILVIGPTDGPDAVRLVDDLRADHVVRAAPGMRLPLGDLALDILWPPAGVEPGNPASVVVWAGPRGSCALCLTSLLLGDLGEKEQRRLVGRTRLPPVDVVKVSHHGSRDQYPGLYDTVRARIALIGVGTPNPYGHPTAQTLRVLQGAGSHVVRSDLDGTVALSTSPGPPGAPPRIAVWRSGARSTSAVAGARAASAEAASARSAAPHARGVSTFSRDAASNSPPPERAPRGAAAHARGVSTFSRDAASNSSPPEHAPGAGHGTLAG